MVNAYRGVLEMKGDAERGKQVFSKTCAACHKVGTVGNDIGPNLQSVIPDETAHEGSVRKLGD